MKHVARTIWILAALAFTLLPMFLCFASDHQTAIPFYPIDDVSEFAPNSVEALIPFSTVGWNNANTALPHSHLLEHGCPQWVIDKFKDNPAALHQIHDGYHAKQYGWQYHYHLIEKDDPPGKTLRPIPPKEAEAKLTPKVAPKPVAAPVQVQSVTPQYRMICNGNRCRKVRVN